MLDGLIVYTFAGPPSSYGFPRGHNQAVYEYQASRQSPSPTERAILALCEGVEVYQAHRGNRTDYVSGPYIAGILNGIIGLLQCHDLGRLDASTIESWVQTRAHDLRVDLNMNEYSGGA